MNRATKNNKNGDRNNINLAFAKNLDKRDETFEQFSQFLDGNFAYFRRLTNTYEDAEDLKQEIFLKFFEKSQESLDWMRVIENVPAYVFRATSNKSNTMRKKNSPNSTSLDDAEDVSVTNHLSDKGGSAYNIIKNMENEEFNEKFYNKINDACKDLPKYEVTIFELYFIDDCTPIEITEKFLDETTGYASLLEEVFPELINISLQDRKRRIKEIVPKRCNSLRLKMVQRLKKSLKILYPVKGGNIDIKDKKVT